MAKTEQPLAGLTVLVTRAKHQAASLTQLLTESGASVIELPVIAIVPPVSFEALDQALNEIKNFDWIVFASTNAVHSLKERMQHLSLAPATLSAVKIAAIGPSTAGALGELGLEPHFQPSEFVAEGLVAQFPGYPHLEGTSILWPRTNVGRELIAEALRQAGATVRLVECYRTAEPEDKDLLARTLATLVLERKIDIVTLASAQSAKNFARFLRQGLEDMGSDLALTPAAPFLEEIAIITIGPETSKAIERELARPAAEAEVYTAQGLVDALIAYVSKGASARA